MTLDELYDEYPDDEFVIADGFNDAIVGIEPSSMRVVYDIDKMINILTEQDMTYEDAIEYLEFNTFGAYIGEKTPIYIRL